MRSEEEIRLAVLAHRCGKDDCRICKTIKDAITELLTLRRRLDREAIADIIWDGMVTYESNSFGTADALIKYLTEGTDGE